MVVALFVEGPTEIEFYKAVVMKARDIMRKPYSCNVEYADMSGVGNYKKDAIRRFNRLKSKYPDDDIYVFLCIDNDAFVFSKKPPFDRKSVQEMLLKSGAKKVQYIVANRSIEDWFLSDFEGVCSYLRLSKSTQRPQGNGQEALKLYSFTSSL